MTLNEFFSENPRVALAFSGGVDSAYLLAAAVDCGADVRPYFVKTAFQPAFELADARRLCQQLGVELTVLDLDILRNETVRQNPPDRCYHCKTGIFTAIKAAAVRDGYSTLLDGTNASDEVSDRPGMRALAELRVRSPLRECGLTKAAIRRLSREAGLFTWDKPAYACLATRVPTGQEITREDLDRVERAEEFLAGLGLSDFRVRLFHGAARIQVPEGQIGLLLGQREEVLARLRELFPAVLLDLQTR